MTTDQFLSDRQRFQEALKSLNETQKRSVLSDATTLQILAGPGSGKTRVLTFRVAYLVIEKQIYPNQIVVVTFTNKAANEMKERLLNLIGEVRTNQLLIGTFHSICCRLLRKHSAYADLDPKFTICDTEQSKDIISKLQKDKDLPIGEFTRKKMTAGAVFGIISKAKSQGENEFIYQKLYGENFKTKDIAIIFMAYEKELKRQNLVDFDNLLLNCCDLLRSKDDVLSRTKCILVDEYQDTNVVQYDLIKLMNAQLNDKTVTIVGDPDQSIFGWRSAEPENFRKMAEEFQETQAINMEQNYRSTSTVIKSAMHVITQDTKRIDKNLYTNNPEGIPISLISTHDPITQAEFVAAEIKKALIYSKGLIQYKDIAVLMRMNAFSQNLEQIFRLNKIPFTMVGGARFFDRVEVKDIISYMLLAYNPKNITAFSRIVNVPSRGIGDVWMKRILELNRDCPNDSMLDTLNKIVKRQSPINFTPNIINNLKKFVDILEHTRSMIQDKNPVADILSFIYETTDYFKYLKEQHFQDHESRKLNLSELLNIAKANEQGAMRENPHYDEFGDMYSEEEEYDSDESLMDMADFQDDAEKENVIKAEVVDESEPSVKNEAKVKSEPGVKSEPSVKSEPGVKSEPRVKREDTGLGINDFESEQEPMDTSGAGANVDNEDDDEESDPVNDFLEYCVLSSNQKEIDEAANEGGKVTIATMHASKGLEWPMVFVVTCNEGVIPHSKCEQIEEEGRLLYVSMTRSKFFLYCISPRNREQWGERRKEYRTHFLNNMNRDLYTTKPPEWNNEVRAMLAETINRPVPENDDFLTTGIPEEHDDSEEEEDQGYGFSSQSMYADNRFGVNGSRADLNKMGGFSSAAGMYKSSYSSSNKNSSKYSSAQRVAVKSETQPTSVKSETRPTSVKPEFDSSSSSSQIPTVSTASESSDVKKAKKRSVAPPQTDVKRECKDKKPKLESSVKQEASVKEEPDQKRKRLENLL